MAQAVEAYKASGSMRKAARFLGVTRDTLERRLRANTATEHMPAPDGQYVKGVSTLYNAQGEVTAQWVKSSVDEQARQKALEATLNAMCKEVKPQKRIAAPKRSEKHLANLYTITDFHCGMYAWNRESGHDWDLKIADKVFRGCFGQMLASSPNARVGIVNNMGDQLHTDGMKALTPEHGHLLDADSRFQKMVETSVDMLRWLINLALEKHELVYVNMLDANHDPASQVHNRVMFARLYEKEPRVIINTSPNPYVAIQHGQTMLGFHHGHLVKNEQLPLLFATQYSEMWGATSKRYAHTGHRHHLDEKEFSGMTISQHPTLAPKDAYAARGGWLSERAATAIFYHEKYGQVGRNTITPEMLEAA